MTTVTDAIAAFQSAIAIVGDLDAASRQALLPARIAGFQMMQAIDDAVDAVDAAIPANPFPAQQPVEAAKALIAAQSALDGAAGVLTARAYLGRAVAAVNNAKG